MKKNEKDVDKYIVQKDSNDYQKFLKA